MSNKINIISCLNNIKTIYPQAYYDKKCSSIRIPILEPKAFLNDRIYITVSDSSIWCHAGLEDIHYYFDDSDDNDDVIRHINNCYSFIENIFEIIKEEIKDRVGA